MQVGSPWCIETFYVCLMPSHNNLYKYLLVSTHLDWLSFRLLFHNTRTTTMESSKWYCKTSTRFSHILMSLSLAFLKCPGFSYLLFLYNTVFYATVLFLLLLLLFPFFLFHQLCICQVRHTSATLLLGTKSKGGLIFHGQRF